MVNHRALVLKSTSEPLLLDTRPIPSASTGSVVVKVLGLSVLPYMQSVINGSLHYLIRPPMVLGSSCIGRVHDVGSDATSLTPGQLVYCDMQVRARDDPNLAILMGLHGNTAPKLMEGEWRDGSYAEYAKFPTENIFPLNEELLFEKFGYTVEDLVQLPGLLVPFGGFSEIGLLPGDTVIVAPATGKFGGSAVTTALAMGASVIACGRNEATLSALSSSFSTTGRISTVIMTGDVAIDTQSILTASGEKGADAYIDFSPPQAAKSTHIKSAMGALKPRGKAVFMGGIQGSVDIDYRMVMRKSLRIQGRFMYERDMILQMIKMVEKGNLKLGEKGAGIKIVGRYGLEGWKEAAEQAKALSGWGRSVVLMPGLA